MELNNFSGMRQRGNCQWILRTTALTDRVIHGWHTTNWMKSFWFLRENCRRCLSGWYLNLSAVPSFQGYWKVFYFEGVYPLFFSKHVLFLYEICPQVLLTVTYSLPNTVLLLNVIFSYDHKHYFIPSPGLQNILGFFLSVVYQQECFNPREESAGLPITVADSHLRFSSTI